MENKPLPTSNKLLIKYLALACSALAAFGFFSPAHATSLSGFATGTHPILEDSVKYRGYRLDLANFVIVKRTDDWVKLRFDVVNSGRVDVDFGKKGTEHWVQVNFDQSIFSNKLGGLRENILQALHDGNFALAAGQVLRDKEMKISTQPTAPKPKEKTAPPPSTNLPEPAIDATATNDPRAGEQQPSDGGNDTPPLPPAVCPDACFKSLEIVEQDDKYATIAYTIENKGNGVFRLFGQGKEGQETLMLRAYISGVPTMSRGALPIGGQFIKGNPGQPGELGPGQTFSGRIRLDVRKKTRYMKSLILHLDSDQFNTECDKTNNASAVVLD